MHTTLMDNAVARVESQAVTVTDVMMDILDMDRMLEAVVKVRSLFQSYSRRLYNLVYTALHHVYVQLDSKIFRTHLFSENLDKQKRLLNID